MTDRLIILSPAPIVRMPIPELFKGRPPIGDNCPRCSASPTMIPAQVEHTTKWTCPSCRHQVTETSTEMRLAYNNHLGTTRE